MIKKFNNIYWICNFLNNTFHISTLIKMEENSELITDNEKKDDENDTDNFKTIYPDFFVHHPTDSPEPVQNEQQ